MAEYIEREASCKDCFHFGVCDILDPLHGGVPCDKFIPAADVVKVVRCKDCRYSKLYLNYFYCENDNAPWSENTMANLTDPDDFCSYGERRKEDG